MEPARNSVNVDPRNAPEPMLYPMKARFRAAACRATRAIPGPIGELVSRELLVIEEFGWSLGAQSFGTRLLHAVEALPVDPPIGAPKPRITAGFAVRGTASETR